MKKLSLMVLLPALIASCSGGSYTERAQEIEILKKLVYAPSMESREQLYKGSYSEDAEIYWNSSDPLSWKETLAGMKESVSNFDQFEILAIEEVHMITNSLGERWVELWTRMRLQANGKERIVPVHISAQFVDLKIVKEVAYWDNDLINELLEDE